MRIIDKAAGSILIWLAVVLCALVFLAPGAFGVTARVVYAKRDYEPFLY